MDIQTAYKLAEIISIVALLLLGTIGYCIGWFIYSGVKAWRNWKKRERKFCEEVMTKFRTEEWRRINNGPKT